MYFKDKDENNVDGDYKTSKDESLLSVILKSNLIYFLLGLIFFIGIILIIVGIKGRRVVTISEKNLTYRIQLLGEEKITMYVGDKYEEPGYWAKDSNGRNATKLIDITNNINSQQIGEYEVIYSIGETKSTRYVSVIRKPETNTKITLTGSSTMYLKIGEAYKEPGYKATDASGNNLTGRVKISSDVNTKKPGTYHVNYTIVNTDKVTIKNTRTVIVIDSSVAITLDDNNYTNSDVTISVYSNDKYFSYMVLPNGEESKKNPTEYKVSENGSYSFKVYDTKGIVNNSTIKVKNINKVKPTGSCSGSFGGGKSTINVTASDDIGISHYVVNGTSYTSNRFTINGEYKEVTIAIFDVAGNSTDAKCTLTSVGGSSTTPSTSTSTPEKVKINVASGFQKYSKNHMPYYVYMPPEATTNMPLILWLHGDDPKSDYLTNNSLGKTAYEAGYPAILVEPYVKGLGSSSNPGWAEGNLLPNVKAIVDEVCDAYKCDKTKIVVGGHSRGAIGTWMIVSKYGNYFHGAFPVSCCSFYGMNVSNFSGVKVWAFRGSGAGSGSENDDAYANCMSSDFNSVKGYAKEAKYTVLPHTTHGGASTYVKKQKALIKFLLTD